MSIKTWQERYKLQEWAGQRAKSECMQAEINELRAALAAKLVPMVDESEVDHAYVRGLKRGYMLGESGHVDAFNSEVAAYTREIEAHHSRKAGGVE